MFTAIELLKNPGIKIPSNPAALAAQTIAREKCGTGASVPPRASTRT